MNGERMAGHPMPEVVLRTRRSVMEAAQLMHTQRQRRKRQMGFVLLAAAVLVLLAAPALWSAVSDLAAGEELTDMPLMLLTLSLVLLTAMFAILLVSWRGARRGTNQDSR